MVKVVSILLPRASIARIVQTPAVASGTVNEQVNPPKVFVTTLEGVVERVTPANVMVIFEIAEKPTPVTVTTTPIGPLVRERVNVGVTEKVAVAVWFPASVT
jgi:hypothetical protein